MHENLPKQTSFGNLGEIDIDLLFFRPISQSQRLQSHLDIMKNRLKECEDAKRDEEHRYRIIEDELVRQPYLNLV